MTVVDVVDGPTRSRMMSGIRGKNTKPELLLRKALHAKGLRFRLHAIDLPGKPDIVFPRFGAVCFVHGCFWHRHAGCKYATAPKTRPEFWQSKFDSNVQRDKGAQDLLISAGWRVAVVWECALRGKEATTTSAIVNEWLHGTCDRLEINVMS